MEGAFWAAVLVHAVVSAAFCAFLAQQKGRDPGLWGLLGLVFGFLALIAVGFTPTDSAAEAPSAVGKGSRLQDLKKKCPDCAEEIKMEAVKCRYCGKVFDPGEVAGEVDRRVREELAEDPTSLHKACRSGDRIVVEKLLDAGVKIALDEKGFSPLHHAILNGHADIVQLLLDHPSGSPSSNPRLPLPTGQPPICVAASAGEFEIVKLLLNHGADPNVGNNSPALNLAIKHGHIALATELIEAGAELSWWMVDIVDVNPQNAEAVRHFRELLKKRAREDDAKREEKRIAKLAERAAAKQRKIAESEAKHRAKIASAAAKVDGEHVAGTVRFTCPSCSRTLMVSRMHIGASGRCNHCGNSITISSADPV